MTEKKTRIIIPRDGIASGETGPRAIYDPVSSKMLSQLGTTKTNRASHVEPGSGLSAGALLVMANDFKQHVLIDNRPYLLGANGPIPNLSIKSEFASHWFADMTPCGHNVVLGPYPPDARDTALAEEVKWLHAHNIPVGVSG